VLPPKHAGCQKTKKHMCTLTDEILPSSVLSYPAPYVLVAPLGKGRMGGRAAHSAQSEHGACWAQIGSRLRARLRTSFIGSVLVGPDPSSRATLFVLNPRCVRRAYRCVSPQTSSRRPGRPREPHMLRPKLCGGHPPKTTASLRTGCVGTHITERRVSIIGAEPAASRLQRCWAT
jgi:hypothetical protein